MKKPTTPVELASAWSKAGDWHNQKAVESSGSKQQRHRNVSATLDRCATELMLVLPAMQAAPRSKWRTLAVVLACLAIGLLCGFYLRR